MQDSPNLIDKPRKNVMASVEVEEERENLSTVSAGADGSQSSGRCVADPLQQMSEEERLSKMQKENQKTCFKRRSSALHLSSVVEGVVPSPLLPLSEINDCYATRPKLMKRSESLSAEKSTGIQGFPSLADKSKHFMFEVVSIDSEEFSSKIVIKNMKTHQLYDLKLESIWSFTKLTVGNKVKIIDPEFQSHNVIAITNEKGLIIVEPTTLVSSTTLVQGFWCKRKAVLSEKFRSSETNFAMMLGIVCHELFQIALLRKPKIITPAWLLMQFRNNMLSNLTFDLIALGVSTSEFETQLKPYLSNIAEWMKAYMVPPMGQNNALIDGSVIQDIEDMEINMWSDVIGVKGRIDVAFRRKSDGRIVPLELKTGKSNYSRDHEAQVLLYCMLLSERDSGQIPPGMLLYLKDATSKSINPNPNSLKQIISTRNGMSIFGGHIGIDAFPDPLQETRLCTKCQFATHCTLTQKVGSKNQNVSEEMKNFVHQKVSHLSDAEIDYGKQWLGWLFAEWDTNRKKKNMDGVFTVPANEREEKGIAIAGLFLVKMESKKLDEYWLTFEKPESLPLPLNILELGEFATISTENFVAIEMGPVVDRQDNSISIRCRKALAKAYTKPGLIFHLDRYETNSSFPMLLNGVINFLDNNTEAKKLREVIVDKKMPTTTSLHSSDIATIKPLLKNLSRNQIRAVIKSLMINDYILIQGFPGSGKTSTIVGIVNCLVALGKNVLLTAYTNTAVDNMLLKLKEVLPEEKLLRIGGNQATFRIDEMKPLLLDQKLSKIENKKELLNEARSMLMKVPVVGTTCLTAANDQFFTWRSRFDYCIVDEAALAIQAAVLKPLMMGTKFILVGDCRQLEPLVLCTNAKNEGMTVSLMEELAPIAEKANVLICLNEQYRMNSRICELSSSLFYDGKLQCANEEIANRTIQINAIDEIAEEFDSELADIILSEKKECSVLFIDTQSREADGGIYHQDVTVAASKSNKGEVQLIKTICEVFVSAKIPGNSIGVMSTYRNQVDELRKNLPKSIETNTVDQFQGRDKDIILISLVHTSSMDEKQQNESHLSEKRLNVALTRAKKKLILVGCAESLSCFPLMKRVIEKIGYVFKLKIENSVV